MEGRNGVAWVFIVLQHNPAGHLACATSLASLPYPGCFFLRCRCSTDEAFMKLEARTERTSCHRAVHQLTAGGICVHTLNPWRTQVIELTNAAEPP